MSNKMMLSAILFVVNSGRFYLTFEKSSRPNFPTISFHGSIPSFIPLLHPPLPPPPPSWPSNRQGQPVREAAASCSAAARRGGEMRVFLLSASGGWEEEGRGLYLESRAWRNVGRVICQPSSRAVETKFNNWDFKYSSLLGQRASYVPISITSDALHQAISMA